MPPGAKKAEYNFWGRPAKAGRPLLSASILDICRQRINSVTAAELVHHLRVLTVDTNTVDFPGALTDATLTWVKRELEDKKQCGAWVAAVSHQNLLVHNSLFAFRYMMIGAGILLIYIEMMAYTLQSDFVD